MKHRYEWEIVNGPIPQGYEINHKCKNRKCFNLDHLECIPKSEHRAKDNAQRYKARASAILRYKKENPEATQKLIASLFGVSKSGVSKILERNY